ncbi:MAG: hypothetical protein SPF56_04020 [Bacteroidaceae bacterium]|nr:hypothetical protein [Prevotellaceae bacterium]MDY5631652.1 hypothetical protein [Bacteroidaceae bacterium]
MLRDKDTLIKMVITYVVTLLCVWAVLFLSSSMRGYGVAHVVMDFFVSALFSLLVVLVINLLKIKISMFNAVCVALFLAFFCPGSESFFQSDENSIMELASQCMVPFFISQYNRVSRKNFQAWYLLMLLMGIFCSYTHNSITIPLCLTFVYLSYKRKQFFHRACWPMVVGFVIGTGLSLWNVLRHDPDTSGLAGNPLDTHTMLIILWEAKSFVFAVVFTMYLAISNKGRRTIRYFARRNRVLSLCLLMSLLTLPLAPLGVDNAVWGISFFSMLWMLAIAQFILRINLINTYKHYAVRKN